MVDLGPLFALGQSLAVQAITTSGTRVQFQTVTRTTDPVTLEPVETTTVHGQADAIVVPVAAGGTLGQALPGVEVRLGDWRIILLPGTTPPEVGVEVKVLTSRDGNLTGRSAKVLGSVSSSAGAVLTTYARPVPA